MVKKLLILLKNNTDIFLAMAIVLVVALLILPIPTFLIDILIALNLALSLSILLIAIYIASPLKLSSFPSILLLMTLFRLGLNVATSRLILLNADAGHMVLAFGNTVVAGNLVVGIVIFLLLMLINLLVIAKGSERVAEVSARFTLDAMPGKQMSIDADLRSGILTLEEAKQKREELNLESQLFGAMDGAMKFVKGDVIACIVIFFINIIAGIIIGVFQQDLTMDEALSTYAILSVGDGLVSIIPGFLISVSAGLIVTRVNDKNNSKNLSESFSKELLAYPKVFFLCGLFLASLILVPGLPKLPLSILALGFLAFAHFFKQRPQENLKGETHVAGVQPIAIEVADNLVPLVDDKSNFISELIPALKESLEHELGIEFPGISLSPCFELEADHYKILLNEIPIMEGIVGPDQYLVAASSHKLRELGIEDVTDTEHPVTHMKASLTSTKHKMILQQNNLAMWDAKSLILLNLSAVLRKNAKDFISIHETQVLLDRLERIYPHLVKEVVPSRVNLYQLTDVLKRLLSEEVSIRDTKTILQALAEISPFEPNNIMLTEHVRTALARYLCYRFGHGPDTIFAFLLSTQIEDIIRTSIIEQPNGSYLALESNIAKDLIDAIRFSLLQLPKGSKSPILLTSQEIRRFVRKLIEVEFFSLPVLSYQEISPEYKVQPIGRITLNDHEFLEPTYDQAATVPAMP